MSRVALTEVIFLATNPASFGRNLKVSVLERDTEEEVDVFSQETGGSKLAQPLTTDQGGRPRGEGSTLGWANEGSYILKIVVPARLPEEDPEVLHVPWEAAKGDSGSGGGGGGTVTSVAGKDGDVELVPADVPGVATAVELEALATQLPFVNVKGFGAKGDGVTDDTAAIQAAIESLSGALVEGDWGDEGNPNGGTVYFPDGKYKIGQLTIGSGIMLRGAGHGSTFLVLADGTDDDLFKTQDFDVLTGTDTEGGPFRFGLCDLTLQGNSENNSAGRGCAIYGRRYFIHRVRIEDFADDGLYSEWYTGGIEMESSIRDLVVRNCKGHGINWLGPHDATFSECYVEEVGAGKIGIWVHEGSAAGANFSQCHVYGSNGHAFSWKLDQAAYLINCQGEGALDAQLHVNASECVALGGHFFVGEAEEEEDESTGIRIGEAAETFPAGLRIATRVSRVQTGVEFASDGGHSDIAVICVPKEVGEASSGFPATTSRAALIAPTPDGSIDQRPKVSRTIASASFLEVPLGVELVRITGATDITGIESNADGQRLLLKFESTAKVIDGENLKLNGDFEGAAGRVLELVCDGTDWFEVGREGGGGGEGVAEEKAEREAADTALTEALAAEQEVREAEDTALSEAVAAITGADAVILKGVIDCSGSPNYPAADAGHLYRVSVAGKIGGGSGVNVEIGDTLLCLADSTVSGNQATVGSKWGVIQVNVDGAVVGPASATDSQLASFDGTTGRLIKDSGLGLDTDATLAANSNAKVAPQKAVKSYVDTAVALLVAKSLVDAKGDLLVGTADNTVARKAAGSNGKVLSAASGESDGLKWIDNNRIIEYPVVCVPTATTLAGFFIRAASGETLKLIGVRHKLASGTCKWKVKRTTSAGSSSEPLKEKESKSEAQETTSEQELTDKDLIEFICESVSSPGLGYFTVLVERTRS